MNFADKKSHEFFISLVVYQTGPPNNVDHFERISIQRGDKLCAFFKCRFLPIRADKKFKYRAKIVTFGFFFI